MGGGGGRRDATLSTLGAYPEILIRVQLFL